jgi:hypothetical protein
MIEWRWGLEPMTMRDRYAKNFAAALDFTTRRDPIDLPAYDPPPARACATGGGRLELQVSREGWVKVICDGPANADCSAKLLALEGELQLGHVPVNKIGQGSKVVLEMRLTDEARALLAASTACLLCSRRRSPTKMAPCAGTSFRRSSAFREVIGPDRQPLH